VVVVSAFSPAHGARAVDALAEGAFDLVAKPSASEGLEMFRETLAAKVRLAAESRRRERDSHQRAEIAPAPPPPTRATKDSKAIVIATSTGGPRALAALVPQLPSPIGIGTLIVQHMPAGFTGSLAARLDRNSELSVREAVGGERLEPHTALLAPGGRHLRLSRDGRTSITEEPAVGGLRPRADLLIEDAARVYGERLLLVVMTGMGNDGLQGASVVRTHGGQVLVEAQETCTVYGMPRAIVDRGLADEVLPLGQLAGAITEATA
jgi:two-component system chemotaxis response regulator CheB